MYSQLLPIDLRTVIRVAVARNLDIQLARQQVEAQRGRLQSAEGEAFPVFSPAALFDAVNGGVRNTPGNILSANFTTLQPSLFIQWVMNPGKVVNDVIAARKRLLAANYQDRAIVQRTLQTAVVQYYDLALAQAEVAATQQDLKEAEELLRITISRVRNAVGLAADESQARAELAARQGDVIHALLAFYRSSVALGRTLDLEPTVTLVPNEGNLQQLTLVRPEIPIDALLTLAVEHRDDLQSVRALLGAATAERNGVFWAGFGPTVQADGTIGLIGGHADNIDGRNQDYGFRGTERLNAAAGWRFGLSSFGDLRTAKAGEREAFLDAQRKLEDVRSEVVLAQQESIAENALISKAREQLEFAQKALTLTRANLVAGTMTTLDVLHAQTVLAQARFRYSTAVLRYNQAEVNLLAAAGVLDSRSLVRATDTDAGGAAPR